jgi:hypothetical protein
MSFDDVISGIMKGVPPRKPDQPDEVYVRRFNPDSRQCRCGEIYIPLAGDEERALRLWNLFVENKLS